MKSSLKVLVLDPLSVSSLSGSSCRKHPHPHQGWKTASGLVRLVGEDREGQGPGVRVILRAEVIAETDGETRENMGTVDGPLTQKASLGECACSCPAICQISAKTKTKVTPSLHLSVKEANRRASSEWAADFCFQGHALCNYSEASAALHPHTPH